MFQPRQLLLQEDLLRASPADSRSLLMICAGVYVLLPIRKPPFLQPEALLFARADFRGRSVGHFGSGNSGHLRLESPAPRGSYCSFISLLGPCLFRLLLACLISENPAPKLSPLDPPGFGTILLALQAVPRFGAAAFGDYGADESRSGCPAPLPAHCCNISRMLQEPRRYLTWGSALLSK